MRRFCEQSPLENPAETANGGYESAMPLNPTSGLTDPNPDLISAIVN